MMSLSNLLKKNKEFTIFSPLDGEVIDINDVPDKVFTSNIIGEGCAIIPVGDTISAPISSKVEIFKTNHLLIFEPATGVYIVIHFGVGTSLLGGQGFERVVDISKSKKVELGSKLVKYDLDYISKNAKSLITPIIVSNERVESIEVIPQPGTFLKTGDPLMKIILK